MHHCPSCNRTFDSQRGLRVHHAQTHETPLPNRTCSHCCREFYSRTKRKYCSAACRDEAVSFVGEDHPNYSGGMETTECDICGRSFEYYPSDKEGLYCITCVEEENWRHRPDVSGENHPRWDGGRIEVDCNRCGVTIERERKNLTGERVFCSDECQYEWLSESLTGEGHPNWNGGTNANYGPEWRRVRERALERDDYRCVICGTSRKELERNPDVHHVVPVRAFVEHPMTTERDAHYLANVVSLCVDCHRKAEFGHISPDRLKDAV